MSDSSDYQEDEQDPLIIPASATERARMIRRLIAHRFYWAMAFFYSLFVNLILIWEHKL
ncbi:hypothetical protein PP586_gp09 [Pseudoalteromonas phage vB_PspS-H40/1]|uniref:hypothetical protein n=1 Tax=Pseudoalteromonas phage vB_PspS-H40/1 TaxID=1856120 RepID=UPI0007DDC811|nr:hypothetical protein PP586_gp09 [Pseudoalteromonas phage vB_PspS-H40/1]ANI22026.1 hypothetical protein H401_9 [Pseudoalteromonas phage vB_PspS-H40/1]